MKIALISDIHLAPGGLNRCGVPIEQIGEVLDELERTHDRLVVGGDLYDLSRPAILGAWRAHREVMLREFGDVLERLEAYEAVFGNHDFARRKLGSKEVLSFKGRVLATLLHGHQFDGGIKRIPGLAASANWVSGWAARLGVDELGRALGAVPVLLESQRHLDANLRGLLAYNRVSPADILITGHTHLLRACRIEGVVLVNSGSWEREPQWVSLDLDAGTVELNRMVNGRVIGNRVNAGPR